MSRGAQQQVQQESQQQLGAQDQLISQANQEGQQELGVLTPEIENLLNGPGYTPAQQSAIEQQGMGAARTAYDALQESAANRVARTNNTAGYNALESELGQQEAQSLANQAQSDQIAFANEQINQQMAGLNALENTYNINTNLLGRAMGVPAQLLNVQEQASKGPGVSTLLGDVGLGLGALFG
ncbi:MAG TPA: hypothetical protein VGR81_00360 [Candidatus Acidoferrales bacterium]|nr:hypothetical protein [Candidatus Acidoferrales bacterium]